MQKALVLIALAFLMVPAVTLAEDIAADTTAKVVVKDSLIVPYYYAAFNKDTAMALSRIGVEARFPKHLLQKYPAQVVAIAEYDILRQKVNYSFVAITPDATPWMTVTLGRSISKHIVTSYDLFKGLKTDQHPTTLVSAYTRYTIYTNGVAVTLRFPVGGVKTAWTVHRQVYENCVIVNGVLNRKGTDVLNLFWEEHEGYGAVAKWKFCRFVDLAIGVSEFQNARKGDERLWNAWYHLWCVHMTEAVGVYYQHDEFNVFADGPSEARDQVGLVLELYENTRFKFYSVNGEWSPTFALSIEREI